MSIRLDTRLVELNIATGRDRAKSMILNGEVTVNSTVETKPSFRVTRDDEINFIGEPLAFVSRGGLKLEKAYEEFILDFNNKIFMDIGASTGGFTDFILQNGGKKVYAVDVGEGQLSSELRDNPNVINMENTNIRYLEKMPEMIDFIVIDVSFISLRLVLPKADEFLKNLGEIICLVKPQFEAGPQNVGKGGVVTDKQIHIKVLEKILEIGDNLGLWAKSISFSPITGPNGNIEYLVHFVKEEKPIHIKKEDIVKEVNTAHKVLKEQI